MLSSNSLIILKDVSHHYGNISALSHVSYQFLKGSLTAICGPNGGGKSTFLKIISKLIKPTSGVVKSHIKAPSDLAYLAQCKNFDRTFPLLVEDVVAMGLWSKIGFFHGLSQQDRPLVNDALSQVGLTGFNKRCLTELSGGQLQRLLFARLIVQQANIILLDEPFTGIDAQTTKDLLKLIQQWHAQEKTIITVLHDIDMIRKFFPESILIARKLIAVGQTCDVLTADNLAKAAFYV